jgi:hypothetical protein
MCKLDKKITILTRTWVVFYKYAQDLYRIGGVDFFYYYYYDCFTQLKHQFISLRFPHKGLLRFRAKPGSYQNSLLQLQTGKEGNRTAPKSIDDPVRVLTEGRSMVRDFLINL